MYNTIMKGRWGGGGPKLVGEGRGDNPKYEDCRMGSEVLHSLDNILIQTKSLLS